MLQASKQFAHILADSAALDQLAEDSQAAIERGVDLVFAEVPSGIRMVVDGRWCLLGRGDLFTLRKTLSLGQRSTRVSARSWPSTAFASCLLKGPAESGLRSTFLASNRT